MSQNSHLHQCLMSCTVTEQLSCRDDLYLSLRLTIGTPTVSNGTASAAAASLVWSHRPPCTPTLLQTPVQAFTTTQLHLLKQQIESLRRINCVLRAVRHKQRTGEDLPAAPSQLESFEGAGMVRVASRNELRVKERSTAKGKKSGDAAAGKKAGRGAKRGRCGGGWGTAQQ